jgi:hypothetical protein
MSSSMATLDVCCDEYLRAFDPMNKHETGTNAKKELHENVSFERDSML